MSCNLVDSLFALAFIHIHCLDMVGGVGVGRLCTWVCEWCQELRKGSIIVGDRFYKVKMLDMRLDSCIDLEGNRIRKVEISLEKLGKDYWQDRENYYKRCVAEVRNYLGTGKHLHMSLKEPEYHYIQYKLYVGFSKKIAKKERNLQNKRELFLLLLYFTFQTALFLPATYYKKHFETLNTNTILVVL